jgi:hypothetical protein
MNGNYLESVLKQFRYYKMLGDKTFEQLSDNDIHWRFYDGGNNIAIIVKHLVGNMLSRWTNFLDEDGEKLWRQRDQEFVDTYNTKSDMISEWNKGWQCLFDALAPITAKHLERIIYIRNQGHTVSEALNRQLAHYAYHVGQIVLLGKNIKSDEWQSLSIPKGESESYNFEKFNKDKEIRHFTDEL